MCPTQSERKVPSNMGLLPSLMDLTDATNHTKLSKRANKPHNDPGGEASKEHETERFELLCFKTSQARRPLAFNQHPEHASADRLFKRGVACARHEITSVLRMRCTARKQSHVYIVTNVGAVPWAWAQTFGTPGFTNPVLGSMVADPESGGQNTGRVMSMSGRHRASIKFPQSTSRYLTEDAVPVPLHLHYKWRRHNNPGTAELVWAPWYPLCQTWPHDPVHNGLLQGDWGNAYINEQERVTSTSRVSIWYGGRHLRGPRDSGGRMGWLQLAMIETEWKGSGDFLIFVFWGAHEKGDYDRRARRYVEGGALGWLAGMDLP
ncbi:hypothetical protein EDB87DRAFT_1581447 [Lactarius vividus]|nr:hypothetical protein EDB87DRAFT_1581447 [Lactarius vividus]